MCHCPSSIRTPFCGRAGCNWQKPAQAREPFFVFAGEAWEPRGGAQDLIGICSSLPAAIECLEAWARPQRKAIPLFGQVAQVKDGGFLILYQLARR